MNGSGSSSSDIPGGDWGGDAGFGRRLTPLGGRETCAEERLLNVVEEAGGASDAETELTRRDEMGMRDLECGFSGGVLLWLGCCCCSDCKGGGVDLEDDCSGPGAAANPVLFGKSLLVLRRLCALGSTASKKGVLPKYHAVGVKGDDTPGEGLSLLRAAGLGLGRLPSDPRRFVPGLESRAPVSTERRLPNRSGRGGIGGVVKLARALALVSRSVAAGATGSTGLVGAEDLGEFHRVTTRGLVAVVGLGLPVGLAVVDRSWGRVGAGRTWSFVASNLFTRSLKETCRERVAAGLGVGFVLSNPTPRCEESDVARCCCPRFDRGGDPTEL